MVDEIGSAGGKAAGWRLDVFDRAQIKRVVEEVAERFGRLDILINNAGFGAFRRIDEDGYDEVWNRALDGLLTAQQLLIRAALRYLRKSDAEINWEARRAARQPAPGEPSPDGDGARVPERG